MQQLELIVAEEAPAKAPDVTSEALFMLRAGKPEDHPFVVDSWVKSYQSYVLTRDCDACGGSGRIYRGARFLRGHKRLVREILARGAALLVACVPGDPDTILGWACTESNTVHYVFVKRDVRRVGIASALLCPFIDSGDHVVYTHRGNIEPPGCWIYEHHRAYFEFDD